jgi:outer membrane protein OmpA-like peptidoglycan-associated protein
MAGRSALKDIAMTGQRDRDPGQTEDESRPAGEGLSQQRADTVRNALIHAGVDPSMVVAKGYGSANPIAGNDLLEGRFRNRRIEYHVLKTS